MEKILIGMILLLLVGCAKQNHQEKVIAVDAAKIQKYVSTSVLFDSIKYIPLETNDFSLFGEIDKLCMDSQDNIFVLDKQGTNAIYMFGRKGEFKRRIGQIGRGPGEYDEISDFNVYRDSVIEIYDAGQDKIIRYDTVGKMIDEINGITMGDARFFHIGDTLGFYRSNGNNAFNLRVIIKDKESSYLKQTCGEWRDKGNYFHSDGSHIYCTDNYNDTLYLITQGTLDPFLYIDFQKYKLPEKIRIVEQAWQGDFCFDIGNFKFTSRFIHFSFSYRQNEVYSFYDRKNKNLLSSLSFLNDINGIPFLLYPNTPNCKDKIVTYLKASILLDTPENELVSESGRALKAKVHEDSNPVIVFAYTKK